MKAGHQDWPVSVIVDGVPDLENVSKALETGPYGRCVYESDNDVVDHQVLYSLHRQGFVITRHLSF